MKIRVLGAFGADGPGQRPAALLIDGRVLIDGGTVGGALSPAEQDLIEHALVTHSHLDHVVGLAFLAETRAFRNGGAPLSIASLEPVVGALRASIFNNVAWPDFAQIPRPDAPAIRFRTLGERIEERVGDLRVTPVAVNHSVPATGFIIHDGNAGVIYSGDTGPTDAIWRAARDVGDLRAVMLECAFPNRLAHVAEMAKHMTPDLVRRELDKLPGGLPVLIYHVKPRFHDEIGEELSRIGGPISLIEQDRIYSF